MQNSIFYRDKDTKTGGTMGGTNEAFGCFFINQSASSIVHFPMKSSISVNYKFFGCFFSNPSGITGKRKPVRISGWVFLFLRLSSFVFSKNKNKSLKRANVFYNSYFLRSQINTAESSLKESEFQERLLQKTPD